MKQSLRLGLRALVLTSLSLLAVPAMGQNIQLHYDLGRYLYPKVQADRPRMTMTVEQQSLDRFGDTFYFVDMSFLQQGAVSANWKFMRNLRFWQGPLSWHVRYDGGLRFINANAPEPVGSRAISLNDAFMTGVTYTYLSPERRTMLSLTPLYKYIRGIAQPHNYELCGVLEVRSWNGSHHRHGLLQLVAPEGSPHRLGHGLQVHVAATGVVQPQQDPRRRTRLQPQHR